MKKANARFQEKNVFYTLKKNIKSFKILIMIKITKEKLLKASVAAIFSTITIGCLTLLTYKTPLGLFLAASFGSSMVLLYGFPESPFAQPKNIFFGHFLTALIGILFVNYVLYQYL